MAYVVLARWWAQAGREDRVVEVLEELARASNAEPGCRLYQPHRATEEPLAFFIYEQYDDEAAFEAHIASEHFKRLVEGEAIPDLLDNRDRTFYATFGGA
jgi:quinol monooxygenase YgiN